jgi:fluoride exporter
MAVGLADNRDRRVANSPYLGQWGGRCMSSSTPPPASAPVDPDVEPAAARRRRAGADPLVLGVIALGGVLGAEARYALSLWHPAAAGSWPATTWWINVTGSFLLGVLMVLLTELTSPRRLLRPFLGVGVLGGFTTFSTAMVDVQGLLRDGRPVLAMGYLVGTVLAALAAVTAGTVVTRGVAAAGARLRARRGTAR